MLSPLFLPFLIVIFISHVVDVSANPEFSTHRSAFPYTCKDCPDIRYGTGLIDLQKIAQIESSNRPNAVGDGGRSVGLFQLSEGVVKDYVKAHPGTTYGLKSRLNAKEAQVIASWYLHEELPRLLRHFKKDVTVDNVLVAYNCGIGCVVKGRVPPITQKYLAKYRSLSR